MNANEQTNGGLSFETSEGMWNAFNGADRLPNGSDPLWAELTIEGQDAVAVVCGNDLSPHPTRGSKSTVLGIEITEAWSGTLDLGKDVTPAGAVAIARALLAGSPTRESLARAGMVWTPQR